MNVRISVVAAGEVTTLAVSGWTSETIHNRKVYQTAVFAGWQGGTAATHTVLVAWDMYRMSPQNSLLQAGVRGQPHVQ
jgi:ATP-dependent protease HslVU (ClpYQ) peptidase subunit